MPAILGLPAKAYTLAHIPLTSHKGVLYFSKNTEEQKTLAELVMRFTKNASVATLAKTVPQYSQQTLLFLPHEANIIIAIKDIETLTLKNPQTLKESSLTLIKQNIYEPRHIASFLIRQGFTHEKTCNTPLTFAGKGEILEVWLPNETDLYRIQFEENNIEQITRIHHNTKAVLKKISKLKLPINLISEKQTPWTIQNYFPHHTLLENLNNVRFKIPQWYHSDVTRIQKDARKYGDFQIFITTDHPHKIQTLFPKETFPKITILPENIQNTFNLAQDKGFIDPKHRVLFLTDLHLFGKTEKQTSLRKTKTKITLDQLTLGCFVVHIYHGIGKYIGLTRMYINGKNRDFVAIQYAGKDKLFVPVDQLDRIERYVGTEHPKLHSLSGNTWQETLHIVKKSTEHIAKELLDQHAKRANAKTSTFTIQSEETILEETFAYELTQDQKTALKKIVQELSTETPMDHLLCGDVGFGKTEIALRAAVHAALNGYQVALLAPTTILAQQHFDTFTERTKGLPIRGALLTRWKKSKEKQQTQRALKDGLIDVIIATHTLLGKDIQFPKLGLVIIDEEQRFGVKQKEKLIAFKTGVHVLTLSATPIPRTLYLALSGIKSISYLETPPSNRKAIQTHVAHTSDAVIQKALAFELNRKGQVYFLHNHIPSIEKRKYEIQTLLPKAHIGIAHGQLPDTTLANVMHVFDQGSIDILLCSTIIENGIDLPNVNTLIVDEAENFGLAQLHQLRGRIGRGNRQAFAYFLTHRNKLSETAHERLTALEEASELGAGLDIAKRDMEIRGIGNILGKEQHGHAVRIGLHLYLRLMKFAVDELQHSKSVAVKRDVHIDLPLEAYIPLEYEPNEEKRLELYRKLAKIESVDAFNDLKQKLSTHVPLPTTLHNLLQLIKIKILAEQSILTEIDSVPILDTKPQDFKIIIKTSEVIPKGLYREPWEYVTNFHVRTKQSQLGNHWLEKITQLVQQLQRREENKVQLVPQ